MHCILRALAVGAAVAAGAAAGASAQTPSILDLKGTWTGSAEMIVEGTTPHNPGHAESQPAGKYRLRTELLTFKFDGQEGRRIWGSLSSKHATEQRIIGSISIDGKWVYMVGRASFIDLEVANADTLRGCARHVTASSALVSCYDLKRQK